MTNTGPLAPAIELVPVPAKCKLGGWEGKTPADREMIRRAIGSFGVTVANYERFLRVVSEWGYSVQTEDTMTQKDYELVARTLQSLRLQARDAQQWEDTVETFAQKFKENNPRFNRIKFRFRCGMEPADAVRLEREKEAR